MKNINRRIITGQLFIASIVLISLVIWRTLLPDLKPTEIAKAVSIASDEATSKASILKCRFSVADNSSQKQGELFIDNEQWEAVKEILLSHDVEKIKPLISTKKNLEMEAIYRVKPLDSEKYKLSQQKFFATFKYKTERETADFVYEGLLRAIDQKEYERRLGGNTWEVGLGDTKEDFIPKGRITFFCEDGSLKIKEMTAKMPAP